MFLKSFAKAVIDPQMLSDITQCTLLNNANVYVIKTDYYNIPITHILNRKDIS